MFPFWFPIFCLLPPLAHSLNILQIVPGFTNSHVLFNYRLASTLVEMGHNVTLWTQMEMAMVFAGDLKLPPGVSEVRVPIHFKDKLKVEGLKVFQEMIFARGTPYELWWTGQEFKEMRLESCEQMLEQRGDNPQIMGRKFDVAIGHFHDMCPVALASLPPVAVEKFVWVTHGPSIYDFTAITLGLRTQPSFVPHPLSPNGHRMPFFGRVVNLLWHLSGIEFVNLPEGLLHQENALYRRMFPGKSEDLWALSARTAQLLMLNGERFLDFPRPFPQNIVHMGELGTGAKAADKKREEDNQLDADLEAIYTRKGSKGVVVFSMGTVSNTTNMPATMTTSFVEAFGRMPDFDFLWKTEQTHMEGAHRYANIHLRRWIPQRKLMKHPRTRMLLAHGGYNSFLEASKAGVPIVLVPLFADQRINAERAKRFGIAETLDKLALTPDAVERAVRKVLEDPSYAESARRLSSMLADKPPSEVPAPNFRRALKLALASRPSLFALKAAQRLSFVQFHCLDMALALFAAVWLLAVRK